MTAMADLPLKKIKSYLFSNPGLAFVVGVWLATVLTEPVLDYIGAL